MSRFLERWSRLKRGDAAAAEPVAPVVPVAPAEQDVPAPVAGPPAETGSTLSPADAALPPIDSLDLAADFSAFMKKEVSESLRRAALRKLFSDPHFHFERMDKLDIYIDDYSGSDPIPADMLQKLRQFETLLRDEEAVPPQQDVAGVDASTAAVDAAAPAAEDPPREPAPQLVAPQMGQERGKTP
jgi:hypothetical protein